MLQILLIVFNSHNMYTMILITVKQNMIHFFKFLFINVWNHKVNEIIHGSRQNKCEETLSKLQMKEMFIKQIMHKFDNRCILLDSKMG